MLEFENLENMRWNATLRLRQGCSGRTGRVQSVLGHHVSPFLSVLIGGANRLGEPKSPERTNRNHFFFESAGESQV